MHTPFPTTGYFGPGYFCDREEETESLIRNIRGGNSTTVVALRRIGKTALVKHLQYKLRKNYLHVYVDILSTESLSDLLNKMASAVAAMVPETSTTGRRVWKFLKSLRPVVSYDSLSGIPTLSFNLSQEEKEKSIGEIFQFLEGLPKPVVFAIDEFQQILNYPEKMVDAWLRTHIQSLHNVVFIFSGSQQHLMKELFADPDRPFYRSTQFLKLDKIDRNAYGSFIKQKFREHDRKIDDETIASILDWADGYTYYVQLLCNRIFLTSGKEIGKNVWKEEALRLLREQEFVFFSYREGLTRSQWKLLKAIGKDGRVEKPTSNAFTTSHELGNPASVLRSLEALQRKELVFKETGADGSSWYGVYDLLFRRWIGH